MQNQIKPIQLQEGTHGLGMKYYNFLKFTLVFGALFNFIFASGYFTGSIYDKNNFKAAEIYSMFPELKSINILYGFVIVFYSIFQLYVRTQLATKSKKAPRLIVILHATLLIPNMLYNLYISQIIGNSLSALPAVLPVLIISPIYAYITYKYFSKRSFLFVN